MSCSRSMLARQRVDGGLVGGLVAARERLGVRIDGRQVEAPRALARRLRPASRRRTGSPRGARPVSSPRCLRDRRPGTAPIDVYVNRSVAPGPARTPAPARAGATGGSRPSAIAFTVLFASRTVVRQKLHDGDPRPRPEKTMARFVAAFCLLLGLAFGASVAARAQPVSEVDARAARTVVSAQLEAFAKDDAHARVLVCGALDPGDVRHAGALPRDGADRLPRRLSRRRRHLPHPAA